MVSRLPLALAARKSGTVTGLSSLAAAHNPLPLPLLGIALTGADIEILPYRGRERESARGGSPACLLAATVTSPHYIHAPRPQQQRLRRPEPVFGRNITRKDSTGSGRPGN